MMDEHSAEQPLTTDIDVGEQAFASNIDDGISSRPFTAADMVELEAIKQTNKIFDRWLRNIMSQKSAALATPCRPTLQNGQMAAPSIVDINW
jgi:hypothetical protein